jgi:hypothetical protein
MMTTMPARVRQPSFAGCSFISSWPSRRASRKWRIVLRVWLSRKPVGEARHQYLNVGVFVHEDAATTLLLFVANLLVSV